MKSLAAELLPFGIPSDAVVEFGSAPSAREVRYLDLFQYSGGQSTETLPTGVIESAARPTVYVKLNDSLGHTSLSSAELQDLIRTLACRADARFLAVINSGSVTVYKIGFLDPSEGNQFLFTDAPGSFRLRNLIAGFDGESLSTFNKSDAPWLESLLFQLMKQAAQNIRKAVSELELSNGDLISLIGRALFTRFLADRDILKDSEIKNVARDATSAQQLFENPKAAVATFQWLDKTFNGHLLHLSNSDYANFFTQLGHKATPICNTLGNIMWRAPGGQLSLDWGGLRFKHIPVDVLSQVYEHFAHENFPNLAKKTSIHYTPRSIAELVVDGTFTALPPEKRAAAKVLDAAAGAGVFLVLSLRRLVGELWVSQQYRPTRKQIRKILNTQLCGMDINPESLKVAALSLYLAALELDPDPQPLSDLKFGELFDSVLHCVSQDRLTGSDAHLGSLAIGTPSIGQFDIVLGNPPWTELQGKEKKYLDSLAKTAVRPLLTDAEFRQADNLVPRQAPDLAFLWKSLQWCKPGGAIGYLLDARLLFSTDHFNARRILFSVLRVTGLLNATSLRKEKLVWPSHDKPYCALVAINSKPIVGDSFYYLNPNLEPISQKLGRIRLDPSAATTVPIKLVKDYPFALKALYKGSALDLSLIQRISQQPRVSFEQYIAAELKSEIRQGYMVSARNASAEKIADLQSLETEDQPVFAVDSKKLISVRQRYPDLLMQRPRKKSIYQGPLLLFRQAPKFNKEYRGAIWSDNDVAYCFSYYGLPVKEHSIGEYLFVLSYSDLFVYWALLTSAKFGVERESFYLEDIRSFPIEPYTRLTAYQSKQCHALANQIRAGLCPWAELESFVKVVYRLSDLDYQLINDALAYALPYSQSLKCAATPVDVYSKQAIEFKIELESALGAILGEPWSVSLKEFESLRGWLFFKISKQPSEYEDGSNPSDEQVDLIRRLADEQSFWTTQLRLQLDSNCWLIGQPLEARFWSKSKARLLALQLHDEGLFSANAEIA